MPVGVGVFFEYCATSFFTDVSDTLVVRMTRSWAGKTPLSVRKRVASLCNVQLVACFFSVPFDTGHDDMFLTRLQPYMLVLVLQHEGLFNLT